MTIRTRLIWAYGISVALTLALVGALVWWQMSDSLIQALQAAQRTRAEAVLSALENQGQTGLQDSDNGAPRIWVVLLDSKGGLIDASAGAPANVTPLAGSLQIDGRTYLLRVDRAGDGTTVVTGADMEPVVAAQAALARILVGVGLAAGVASLFAGWILAGRALRPIDRLIADADALGPGELERRLAEPRQLDEVGRLTTTLNRMLDRISDSVARQRLFIALASHELRTPLTALRAELDLASRSDATIADYRVAVREAQTDVLRLTALTASLLDLATIGDEAHPIARTPVAVNVLADSAMRAVRPLIEHGRAMVRIDVPQDLVWVDRGRVEQALVNLLTNAIVHSGTRPDVELHAEIGLGPLGSVVRFNVLDRGPGFGQSDPADLFEPFRRGLGARVPGSGLGLAMVAAAARAHGGSFGALNRDGGGAIVWFEITASRDGRSAPEPVRATSVEGLAHRASGPAG